MTSTISRFYANAKRRIRKHAGDTGKYAPVQIIRTRDEVRYRDVMGEWHFLGLEELRAARNAVKRGAALLDRKLPGWESILQLDQLQLASCEMCVCGQLAWATKTPEYKAIHERFHATDDGFGPMLEYLGLNDSDRDNAQPEYYGFDSGYDWKVGCSFSYEALEVEWHRLVSRRLRTGKVSGA